MGVQLQSPGGWFSYASLGCGRRKAQVLAQARQWWHAIAIQLKSWWIEDRARQGLLILLAAPALPHAHSRAQNVPDGTPPLVWLQLC